jgi:hypothetical protein
LVVVDLDYGTLLLFDHKVQSGLKVCERVVRECSHRIAFLQNSMFTNLTTIDFKLTKETDVSSE